jgi:hypothetical protein
MISSSPLKTKSKYNLQYFINQGSKAGLANETSPKGEENVNILLLSFYRLD